MMLRIVLAGLALAGAVFPQCTLTPGPGLNLGPTAPGRLRSTGPIRMAFLFVDFPDAPASENAEQLYRALVPYSQQWVEEVSGGRARLEVTPTFRWFRMPAESGTYNFARGLTFELHRRYIADAVAAADSVADFSQFDGAYILASRNAQVPFSPTWVPNPGQGIAVDGVDLRHVITLGADVRSAIPDYDWHVISHETGHLMGLPDLYLFTGSGLDVHVPVGSWDNMGWIRWGAHFTAWQKRKLGWITAEEFACVTDQVRYVELSPVEGTAGIRGLAVQTGPGRALVAEVRRPVGHDSRLCDQGLLVYSVDSQIASGQGPMVVQRAVPDSDAAQRQRCGPGYNATYNLDGGKPRIFRDAASGVSFEILGASAGGSLFVRVMNPAGRAAPDAPVLSSVIGAGAFGGLQTIAPGGWIEIFGQNLAASPRTWTGADFQGLRAPEQLDGVRVFIGGKAAFVWFISPSQVNVQVPDGLTPGQVAVTVVKGNLASNTLSVTLAERAPGLLSPPAFSAGGKQYAVAILPDGTYVGPPGLIPGAAFRRVKAGETAVLYGVGFGSTIPPVGAGFVADRLNQLADFRAEIGGAAALASYAGLAVNLVGLYQFNLTVPTGVSGDVPVILSVGGVTSQPGPLLAVE